MNGSSPAPPPLQEILCPRLHTPPVKSTPPIKLISLASHIAVLCVSELELSETNPIAAYNMTRESAQTLSYTEFHRQLESATSHLGRLPMAYGKGDSAEDEIIMHGIELLRHLQLHAQPRSTNLNSHLHILRPGAPLRNKVQPTTVMKLLWDFAYVPNGCCR